MNVVNITVEAGEIQLILPILCKTHYICKKCCAKGAMYIISAHEVIA